MEGFAKTGASHCLSLAYIFSPGWSTFSLSNRLPSFSSCFLSNRSVSTPVSLPLRSCHREESRVLIARIGRLLFQGETHTVPRPTALLFQRQIALKIIYLQRLPFNAFHDLRHPVAYWNFSQLNHLMSWRNSNTIPVFLRVYIRLCVFCILRDLWRKKRNILCRNKVCLI